MMYNSILRNVAAVIGTLILLHFSLHLLSNLCTWIRAYFLAPWGIGRTNLKKYGPWASEVLSLWWLLVMYIGVTMLTFKIDSLDQLGMPDYSSSFLSFLPQL